MLLLGFRRGAWWWPLSCDVIVRWCDGDEERYDAIARPAITPLAKEQDDRDDIGADVALQRASRALALNRNSQKPRM